MICVKSCSRVCVCACVCLCWLLLLILVWDGINLRTVPLSVLSKNTKCSLKVILVFGPLVNSYWLTKFYLTHKRHYWCKVILVSNDLSCILSLFSLPDSLTCWKCIWKNSPSAKPVFRTHIEFEGYRWRTDGHIWSWICFWKKFLKKTFIIGILYCH